MPKGFSMPRTASGLTGDHPLRERFRQYVLKGEHYNGRTLKTYPEMAADLDRSGTLSVNAVWRWLHQDFPEIAQAKQRQFKATPQG